VDWIVGYHCHCGIVDCLCLIVGPVVCVLGNKEGIMYMYSVCAAVWTKECTKDEVICILYGSRQ
jgi:hypothetical protein